MVLSIKLYFHIEIIGSMRKTRQISKLLDNFLRVVLQQLVKQRITEGTEPTSGSK